MSDPQELGEVRDEAGMTSAERQAWRDREDARRRALPQAARPRRADRPAPVADPAAHGHALAARCLRNAQGRQP